MKRQFAAILATCSGLYLLTVGLLPDPLPIIDEVTALWVFVKAMAYLGYDVRKWVPFLGKGKVRETRAPRAVFGRTVDV